METGELMTTASFLQIHDLRLHYLHWGLPGGRPVMLLHGLASNARIWELVAPLLAEHGLRLLAWEARGHGLSDKPDGDYGFDAIVNDLRAFIEACKLEHPLLVGHSWGGHLALEYAARFPVGMHAPNGLVLVDGGFTQMSDAPGVTWEQMRERLTPPRLAGMALEDFTARLRQFTAAWGPSEQALEILLANFAVYGEGRITPHLSLEHHMQIVRAMWGFPTYQRFEQVRCPVLAVPARPAGDPTPQEMEFVRSKERGLEQARQAIHNLQVRWLADTIHDIPLQRPDELANLILEFVKTLR
jgi:pimeloyl-ACP methyl ester carboxylesterase